MKYDKFNEFCAGLAATTHVVQWGNSDVWKVGGKVFAVGGWAKVNIDKSETEPKQKPAFTFKTSDQNYYFLEQKSGFRPAPYLASRGMKWIQLYDINEATRDELFYYITESHRIVSLGLTKKKQKELGLNQSEVN